MKLKNVAIVLILMLSGTISCRDENVFEPSEVKPPEEIISPKVDMEAIYRNQTDKNLMLNSFIRYDYTAKKYLLDISEKDVKRLRITDEAYRNGLKFVEQMNQLGIERK